MKLIHFTPFSKQVRRSRKRGFALIATLTLMMLLTLIAVGLIALASSQTRIAQYSVMQAEARQQALVGLDAAIAELQVELGPDQRVSASSGILQSGTGASTTHLLGVWNSWDGPIYGRSVSGKAGSIQSTYDKGRSNMFRRWLISSRDKNSTRNLNAAEQLSRRSPGERICLVGEGTLGRNLGPQHYIYADLITMPSDGENKACFAWWIGGENQKAKVGIVDPEDTTDPVEVLHRTWNTPGPSFREMEGLGSYLDSIESKQAPAKLLTLASVPLLGDAPTGEGAPYFYDVTTSSQSLLTNVSRGGLKQDLCLLLNKPNLKGTEFEGRVNQDCPIAEDPQIPTCSEANFAIGSWQNLHSYYNTWPDGSADDSRNFTARLIGRLNNAYTRMSGSVTDGKDNSRYITDPDSVSISSSATTSYDNRAMLEQGSVSAGYGRTPVMLAFMNNFGLVTSETGSTGGTESQAVYRLELCFAPMVLWWNPYNVPMRIRGRQMWSHAVPYKTTWLQSYAMRNANSTEYSWSCYAMKQDSSEKGYGQDFGEYFQKSLSGERDDIVFRPGEILFFSPGKARTTQDYSKFAQNPWVVGYNPSNVAGYKALFYSGKAATDVSSGKFYLRLQLGKSQYEKMDTDGYYFAPGRRECLTPMHGFGGMSSTPNAETGGLGKGAHSPQYMTLGWYDPDGSDNTVVCDEDRNGSTWSNDGTQSDSSVPYYVASLGIVAKSANPNMDSRVFAGRDYRAKIWQHSSPAFYGSSLALPDDQQRQYHPFQLAVMDVSAGLAASPMDNIGDNGFLGITSDGEQVSFASVLELPMHPPFSLAGFAGMRLQPGWYKTGSDMSARRRMQYQSGVPGVGIGNSFADPCLPPNGVYTYFATNIPTTAAVDRNPLSGNERIFGEFYDHGLLINDALWDRWFCSSISDMPTSSGTLKAQNVLQDFLSGSTDLPVARYKKVSTPYDDSAVVSRLMADDGWKYVAQYLVIDGGFNVNSTSVDAWAAVLEGLAKRRLVSNVNGNLSLVEPNKADTDVLFSRFMVSTTDKSIDSTGSYSPMQGSSQFRRNNGMLSAWGEVRKLSSDGIRNLAERIVEQVKERGPFLSMSDFINRRLDSAGSKHALTGALQAAIDATDINMDFNEIRIDSVPAGSLYKFSEAAKGPLHTAAPGYLIQSDVLMSLGNILTVRDDTFVVRAFGCVRNRNNIILAQAWCEAVVQRTMDYVDATNAPYESEYKVDGSKSEYNLSKVNKVMGRKFRVVSFKWLDAWDI